MASRFRTFVPISPWAGAFALGSAVVCLALYSGRTPTRPWLSPPAPRGAAPALSPLRPVAYHHQPVTIQPVQLLELAGRRAPEATFRVQLTAVLQDGKLKVSSASGLLVEDMAQHRLAAQVPANTVYTVSLSADGRAVSGPMGDDLSAERVRIEPIAPDTPMETGSRSYLGALEVSLGAAGLDVTNEVRQEDYIAGVVAGEAARSFPLEALKAQAVAARTYALSQRGHRGSGIDVVDTVADQVYTGAGRVWPECRQAVDETAGQIATYSGRPIVAYFSADCGGTTRTNTAAGLGGGDLPYLRAVKDGPAGGPDYCAVSPKHEWSTRLTSAEIAPKLKEELGVDIEDVTGVHFTRIYSDGRVGEVEVQGLGAPKEAIPPATAIATAPKTLTPAIAIEKAPKTLTPPPAEIAPAKAAPAKIAPAEKPAEATVEEKPAEAATSGDTPVTADADAPNALTPPAGEAAEPSPTAGEHPEAPQEASPAPNAEPPTPVIERPAIREFLKAFDFRKIVGTKWLRSQIMSVAADGPGAWLFSGRGYGHGVGLCQWGACGMARQGITYTRILKHYYTGIALEQNPARNGVLQGIARDADGHPLVNAVVTLAGTDREVKTDAAGHFRFDALPAGTYDIVLTPKTGTAAVSYAWTVAPDETTDAALKVA